MSSHHPRSGSASASATPAPTPSPQPPTSEDSLSQPSSRSGQSQSQSRRTQHKRRPGTAPIEEQPGLEVYNPPTSTSNASPKRPGPRRPGTAPEVYWSDDTNAAQSQYTFYREPTPTPPEYLEREKEDGYVGTRSPSPLPRRPGRSSTIALETALSIPPADPGRRSSRHETICGLKRWVFVGAVAGVVLLVLAVAIGVGVGVNAGKKANQAEKSASSSSSSLPTTTESPTATTSSTTSSPSSPSSASTSSPSPIPTASTDCPFINNTIYQLPGSDKKFLRLCGIDYSGGSEAAVELANKPTFSFADCIGNCAGTYGCTGCAWGIVSPDEGADHQCWMKSDLKTGHGVAPDWCFAILQA